MNRIEIENMRVLSVDDNRNNLLMIEAYSKKLGLSVKSFLDPLEAYKHSKETSYDIVIVDYMMPEMDGIEFIRAFRAFDDKTPIVMVTAAGEDVSLQLQALEAGATDFLHKPLNGGIFQARLSNLLILKKSMRLVEDKALLLTAEVKEATETIRAQEQEALSMLGKLAEYRDPETSHHVLRVSHYSRLIAKAYGLGERMQDIIFNASPFHDIGKVGTPDRILLKPGKLTAEEWAEMQEHSKIGYDLLKGSKSPYLQSGSVIAISHHERFDGSGYPKGTKGNMIPLYGRIVAVADVFDALCSPRPYKKKWSFEDAFNYIVEESGKHFDPKCVQCFVESREEILKIYRKYGEAE